MSQIAFERLGGLIVAVIQRASSGEVLMVGYLNQEALTKTLAEGRVWFYSRSRQRLWRKGERSGNSLFVKALYLDCDEDALLIQVEPSGPVCHTGMRSCFFKECTP